MCSKLLAVLISTLMLRLHYPGLGIILATLVWAFQSVFAISNPYLIKIPRLNLCHPICAPPAFLLNRACYIHLHLKFLNTEISSKLFCLPRKPVICYHLLEHGMPAPQHLLCKDGNGQNAWNVDGSKLTVFSPLGTSGSGIRPDKITLLHWLHLKSTILKNTQKEGKTYFEIRGLIKHLIYFFFS